MFALTAVYLRRFDARPRLEVDQAAGLLPATVSPAFAASPSLHDADVIDDVDAAGQRLNAPTLAHTPCGNT